MRRLAVALVWLVSVPVAAATFTVVNTNDSGSGSLRQAILDANANAGGDLIAFGIAGPGVHTITPLGPLPPIIEAVTIDGYTQPGSSPNTQLTSDDAVLLIEINGESSGDDSGGLDVSRFDGVVTDVTIRGLVVNRFSANNVLLNGSGHHLEGCFIGTDPTGAFARSRSSAPGVAVWGSSTIGGTLASQRNVISGNNGTGISAGGSALIQGNFIGVDATGTASLANFVGVSGGSAVIGGSTAQAGTPPGNVISGNQSSGLTFHAIGNRTLTIQGNLIGTDTAGAAAIPNGGHGLAISRYLGGICERPRPPSICFTPGYAVVGGDDPLEGNVIAYNLGDGIAITGGPGSLIRTKFRSNRIHANIGLAIDRGNNGVTPNAEGSSYNYPVLTSAASAGGSTTIQGTLNRVPNGPGNTIEFFSSAVCDESGYGEGAVPIGSATVTTDASGWAVFSVVLPVSLETGSVATSTASKGGITSEFSRCQLVTTDVPPPLNVLVSFPSSGSASGGTSLTVLGTGFLPGASLTVGGIPAGNVVVVDPSRITAMTPVLLPGTLNDVSVVNPLGASQLHVSATLPAGWMADFLDVPQYDLFHTYVEKVFRSGITAGCGGGNYCRNDAVRRDQMAVFLLKARHGSSFQPPSCVPPGAFLDVACPGPFTDWVEELSSEAITDGCGDQVYCPNSPVRRDQMSVFLLKAGHGPDYAPPFCTGVFYDVACPSQFADWIEQLAAEGVTSGCGSQIYCPESPATRGEMAVFLVRTFGLP